MVGAVGTFIAWVAAMNTRPRYAFTLLVAALVATGGLHCAASDTDADEDAVVEQGIDRKSPNADVQLSNAVKARVQDWYDRVVDFKNVTERDSAARNLNTKQFIYLPPPTPTGLVFRLADESANKLIVNRENHPHPESCVKVASAYPTCAAIIGFDDFAKWNSRWPVAPLLKDNLRTALRIPSWLPLAEGPMQLTRHQSEVQSVTINFAPNELSPRQKTEWGDLIATWTVKVSMDVSSVGFTNTLPNQYVKIQASFASNPLRIVRYTVKEHRLF
jgi:hypothetical protein